MDPGHDGVWPPAAEVPRERARLGDRRTAPRYDDDVRAAQRAPVFAPGTSRQRPRDVARGRTLRAHDGDVDVARDIEPLIGVIEHEHPCPPGAGAQDGAIEDRGGQPDAPRHARGGRAAPPQPLGNPLSAHPVPMTSRRLWETTSMPRRNPSLPAAT